MSAAKAPDRWRNRIVGSSLEAPDSLLANPSNWRTHPGEQRDAIRGSLAEVGWVQQVIVNDRTGHVVDGHARIEEALSAGAAEIPVLHVDLSIEEEQLVLASLDPIAAMAGVDKVALDELLGGLSVNDEGLRRMLADLGGPEGRRDGLVEPDAVPPMREDPGLARGELWTLGDHRLMIGDATSATDVGVLVAGAAADLVWTDPPYGVDYEGATEERLKIEGDAPGSTRALLAASLGLAPLKRGGVFYIAAPSGPAIRGFLDGIDDAGWGHRQTLVWVKDRFVLGRSDFHYRHEAVLVGDVGGKEHDVFAYGWKPGAAHRFLGGRRLDTVWEIPRPSSSREHPTMKPVDLVARALEYSTLAGERVYDPFAGSGTTVIACEQLGRIALVMEIDPRYARVVIDRWEQFTGRQAARVE